MSDELESPIENEKAVGSGSIPELPTGYEKENVSKKLFVPKGDEQQELAGQRVTIAPRSAESTVNNEEVEPLPGLLGALLSPVDADEEISRKDQLELSLKNWTDELLRRSTPEEQVEALTEGVLDTSYIIEAMIQILESKEVLNRSEILSLVELLATETPVEKALHDKDSFQTSKKDFISRRTWDEED